MPTVSFNLSEKIIKALKKQADDQTRSVSNVVEILLTKALELEV